VIESEPGMAMTNFGGNGAYLEGTHEGGRGVMANVQTPCLQLPNIFAFSRGAVHLPLTDADYIAFAERLIRTRGSMVVGAWQALGGTDATVMRTRAQEARGAA